MSDYFELTVTLNQYAGNHDRALTWWVFGIGDSYGDHIPSPAPVEIENKLITFYGEYGLSYQAIGGTGLTWRTSDVIWRLSEALSETEWKGIIAALKGFPGATVESVKLEQVVTRRIPQHAPVLL